MATLCDLSTSCCPLQRTGEASAGSAVRARSVAEGVWPPKGDAGTIPEANSPIALPGFRSPSRQAGEPRRDAR